jgi:hypothetical protein
MPDPTGCRHDGALLEHLAKIATEEGPVTQRIFRSLDWIRFAFSNFTELPYQARVVALVTAFEILLVLPQEGKGRHFSEAVNKLLPRNKLPTTQRTIGSKEVVDNAVGWWCRDFYALHSKIVHGGPLHRNDFYSNEAEHLRIGLSLMGDCIVGLLADRYTDLQRGLRVCQSDWLRWLGLSRDAWYESG